MLKNKQSPMWRLLGAALLLSLPGCATAYRDYSGCCIPYVYCPPPPLPYVTYESCHCPTPGTSLRFQQHGDSNPTIPQPEAPRTIPQSTKQVEPTAPTPE